MSIDVQGETGRNERPLTREDVEQLLQQAGSPDKLNLSGMNLQEIDLRGFNLAGVNLRGATLTKANLFDANLSGAILAKANLSGANLFDAVLSGANLFDANLSGAILYGTDLREANLREANLHGADLGDAYLGGVILGGAVLGGADLSGADLSEADLRNAKLPGAVLSGADLRNAKLNGADLSGADLSEADLGGADLRGANLTNAEVDEGQLDKAQLGDKVLLHNIPVLGVLSDHQDFFHQKMMNSTKEWFIAVRVIPIRITEEPLTPYNLAIALTALTELTTKFWLIAKRRFDDLIEYTQTHDARFAKEAGATIAYATYNSPFTFGFQVDKLVPSVADATMTVVNGLTQRKANLEKLELENQAAAQKIKEAEQKAQQEQQMAALEKEKQELALEKERLAIEEDRLALVEHRLDIQKKGLEDALELASKTVDILRPNADPDARAMMIQSVLPSILQLQNVTGLELALPPPKKEEENN